MNIGTLHGPALHRELERMAEAGLAPLAILKAASQGGARAMGRGSDLGTLEAENALTSWSWMTIRRAISGMYGAFIAWSGEA